MLIDTHCHIYLEHFSDDIDEVLQRAADVGIAHIFMPAISLDSGPKMELLSHAEITFHKMAGLHPTELNKGYTLGEKALYNACRKDEIIAVGETGLDYYWSDEYQSAQKEHLHRHCWVAKELGKPIILHNRESTDDLLTIIEEEQNGGLTGIWHCFNGTVAEGRRAIDAGFYLGIGGVLTFKNAGVDKTVAQLPIERMVLETDAPYLAPEPNRGQRNEPAFVKETAKRLSEVLGLSIDDIERITSNNAIGLFSL